jgi:hypothetical protein
MKRKFSFFATNLIFVALFLPAVLPTGCNNGCLDAYNGKVIATENSVRDSITAKPYLYLTKVKMLNFECPYTGSSNEEFKKGDTLLFSESGILIKNY